MLNTTKLLRKLTSIYSNSQVFNDFMKLIIQQFMSPNDKPIFPKEQYKKNDIEIFREAFFEFLREYEDKLKTFDWYDLIGEIWQELELPKNSIGQFFTSQGVVNFMAKLSLETKKALKIFDPSAGSSRTLIAVNYERQNPNDKFFAIDIDYIAYLMSIINFLLNRMQGIIIWGNSITLEAWEMAKTIEFCKANPLLMVKFYKINKIPFEIPKINKT